MTRRCDHFRRPWVYHLNLFPSTDRGDHLKNMSCDVTVLIPGPRCFNKTESGLATNLKNQLTTYAIHRQRQVITLDPTSEQPESRHQYLCQMFHNIKPYSFLLSLCSRRQENFILKSSNRHLFLLWIAILNYAFANSQSLSTQFVVITYPLLIILQSAFSKSISHASLLNWYRATS